MDRKIMTSEYCAPGHPDRMCDCVVSNILDHIIVNDAKARVALECQIKDNFVSIAGEVTTTASCSDEEIKKWTREAIEFIGYTEEYAKRWGEGNTINPAKLEFSIHLSKQSPDISMGVDNKGWGDQGIFWGCAVRGNKEDELLPPDYALARRIGLSLYGHALFTNNVESAFNFGLDIKTQVTMIDGAAKEIVVAIPYNGKDGYGAKVFVNDILASEIGLDLANINVVINGTGRYVKHSTAGDCGTTGRKLVADSYGGGCRIGGGCFWGKDPTKADVTLNVLARKLAKESITTMLNRSASVVEYAISCCIGRNEVRWCEYVDGKATRSGVDDFGGQDAVIKSLELDTPDYFRRCRFGIFQ